VKKLGVRLGAVALIVVALQFVVGQVAFRRKFRTREAVDGHLARAVPVLYLGDSVIGSFHPADADRRDIAAMVQDRLPPGSVGLADRHGYDLDMFREFTDYVARQPQKPKRIVIPINLRSFSPAWDRRPQYQGEFEKLRLRHGDLLACAWSRPLSSFKLLRLNPISQQEFLETPVFRGTARVGTIRDFDNPSYAVFSEEKLRNKFVLDYLYPLARDHRKIRSMLAIEESCRRSGIAPLFYVSPVDVESGTRSVGPEFKETIASHTKLLRELLAERQVPLLDLSASLDASTFDWRDRLYPNEHLKEKGRRFLADEIAKRVSP